MSNFSFIKNHPRDIDVNPAAQYVKPTQTIRHDYGDGNTTGAQVFSIKVLANQPCDVIITPNSGQTLTVAFSYNKDAIKNWINSNGFTTSNLEEYTSATPITKSFTASTFDYYVWYAVAKDGFPKPPTPVTDTYSCEVSGNFGSPESILVYTSSGSLYPVGTFANPAPIGANITNVNHSTINGDCQDGSYYFSFIVDAHVLRTMTFSPPVDKKIAIAYSSIKSELKDWITNNGSGPLTNGGSLSSATNGDDVIVEVEKSTQMTMYAVLYNPDGIGDSSCSSGFNVEVSSTVSTGSYNSGTYTNPRILNNVDNQTINQNEGECRKGAYYIYLSNICDSSTLNINVTPDVSQNIGVLVSSDKNVLANYILNTTLPAQGQGSGQYIDWQESSSTISISFTPISDFQPIFIIVYDPSNLNSNICSTSNTFTITTEQINCLGGGAGQDGTAANPYQIGFPDNTNINSPYSDYLRVSIRDGDCTKGRIYFQGFSAPCLYTSKRDISIYANGVSNTLGVYFGSDPFVIDNDLDNGNSGDSNGSYYYNEGDSPSYFCIYQYDYPTGYNTCTETGTIELTLTTQSNCNDIYGGDSVYGTGPSDASNPKIINVGTYYQFPYNMGECENSHKYFRVNLCDLPATVDITTPYPNVSLAWSNSLTDLVQWAETGRELSSVDLSIFDGGYYGSPDYSSNISVNITPANKGVMYLLMFESSYPNDTCSEFNTFSIQVTQATCEGPGGSTGTFSSPIEISPNSPIAIDENTGECLRSTTYFSFLACAGEPLNIRITPSSGSTQQMLFYSNSQSNLQYMVNYYYDNDGNSYTYYGGRAGSFNNDVSDQFTPQVENIPSSITQEVIYFALIDKINPQSGRCSRSTQFTVEVEQDCPVTLGTASISGAYRFDIDPFDDMKTKNAIAIKQSISETEINQRRNIIFSPILDIDQADSFSEITCAGISASLYTNNSDGYTSLIETKTTNKTEVIIKDNVCYIKPLTMNEFTFENVSFYTAAIRVTYQTSVGVFVRNQIINLEANYSGGREHRAYNISQNSNVIDCIIPIPMEDVHNLESSPSITSYTLSRQNRATITLSSVPSPGTLLTLPIKTAEGNSTVNIKILTK